MSHVSNIIGTGTWVSLAVVLVSAGCSMAPVYRKPAGIETPAYKEVLVAPGTQESFDWKIAQPSEQVARGEWWSVFHDTALDGLERQALQANQNLRAAAARLTQARAVRQAVRGQLSPTLDAGLGVTRGKQSSISLGLPDNRNQPVLNMLSIESTASYEVDLFGRVSDGVKAAAADAERSEDLFLSILLALQADVAQNYFNLRELDAELDVFNHTVTLREDALKLVTRRFEAGQIGELDVARARSELNAARTETMAVQRMRAASEHSLAILLGEAPAAFTFGPNPLEPIDIRIAPGLPSSLLERRPDIAAAERAMAAANARIGVAKSAFFPSLTLTGNGGFESGTASNLFSLASRTFLFGPALSLPVFDGGRRRGNLAEARAHYEEDLANYRQQVLVAFKEVEDNLADLRFLRAQIQTQTEAVEASTRAAQLARTQYREGAVDYLDVIDAERTVLQSQRVSLQLTGAQAVSTVNLIRALGGGWGG